jgi:hypothetical protein
MESDPGLSFELVAASLRADAADLGVFLEVLAAKLERALPGLAAVETTGGLIGKRRVRQLNIELGEHRYELARERIGLAARRIHRVRGVSLKTEQLALEQWIDELSRGLAEHARESAAARAAIARLVQ